MAHQNTVVSSINSSDGTHCVDIFRRADGSYGFDVFRRDPEDPGGWYSVGFFADEVFSTSQAAHLAAQKAVPWLKDA